MLVGPPLSGLSGRADRPRVIDGIGCSSLGAGSWQAGGRDRDDQGNTASDPRRRGAQQ